jgi:hypothetical protein
MCSPAEQSFTHEIIETIKTIVQEPDLGPVQSDSSRIALLLNFTNRY